MKVLNGFSKPKKRRRCFFRSQDGQGLTEYLILLTLVGVVCLVSVKSYGSFLRKKMNLLRSRLNRDWHYALSAKNQDPGEQDEADDFD
jgi:hypothetical protein